MGTKMYYNFSVHSIHENFADASHAGFGGLVAEIESLNQISTAKDRDILLKEAIFKNVKTNKKIDIISLKNRVIVIGETIIKNEGTFSFKDRDFIDSLLAANKNLIELFPQYPVPDLMDDTGEESCTVLVDTSNIKSSDLRYDDLVIHFYKSSSAEFALPWSAQLEADQQYARLVDAYICIKNHTKELKLSGVEPEKALYKMIRDNLKSLDKSIDNLEDQLAEFQARKTSFMSELEKNFSKEEMLLIELLK